MHATGLWKQVKSELRKKLNPHNYESWIEPISCDGFDSGKLTLVVPSTFFVDWIEEKYKDLILQIIQGEGINGAALRFQVSQTPEPAVKPAPREAEESAPLAKLAETANLSEKHVFDNFVVGKSNEFCNASCKAVAHNPGKIYNPLFIYGGVGLGKTHLLQAIGIEVLRRNSKANVLYLSSEKFVNLLINALQQGRMEAFRKRFRSLDLLLVDDIQFIGGKERTQEEFFHTFNSLFEMKKQIVVTSDKFPKDIKNLEERLRSRFAWGLIADIQPPELEIKIAILRKIARQNGIDLDEEVAAYLAGRIKSNIRELEGSLARVMAYASLTGRAIDLDLVADTLKGIYDDASKSVDLKQIQKAVSDYYSLKISDLKSKSRSKNVALPRHVAIYLCREFTSLSLPEIGKAFGGRDHTTVMHAVGKIKGDIEVNTQLYNEINEIKRALDL
ncbi:MAG: chromosomal replication initiator protein DnaA [Nitrospinae bacterium]|nr:chromosomal replication initiator protein DnaA [Nitrospinota bacterium]